MQQLNQKTNKNNISFLISFLIVFNRLTVV